MRKLAHIRARGYGLRTWSGARWFTPGATRLIQFYDAPTATRPTNATRWTPNGTFTPVPVGCRPANMSAFRLTDPAIFQSAFKVRWEDMFGARANLEEGARQLPFRGSPSAPGRAEGQALIGYDPFPSAGELYPGYGGF